MRVDRHMMPVVTIDDADFYMELRNFAYGCSDRPPDGGFSFLVKTDYLDSWLRDGPPQWITNHIAELLAEVRFSPFFIVRGSDDSFEPLMPSHQEIGYAIIDPACIPRIVL